MRTMKLRIELVVLLVAFLSILQLANAQRSIFNLAKKLQKKGSTAKDEFIIEGEQKIADVPYSLLAMTVLVLITGTYLLLADHWYHKTQDKLPEDEFVVEDGHFKPLAGMEQVDLAFENIKLVLLGKKGTKRLLLDGVKGRAKPGRMLAIMGPSGAGKSILLHALAGRIKDSPKLELYGQRYINGEPVVGNSLIPAAFVEQEVNFFPHMTVRETLHFRVELKVGSKVRKAQRDQIVNDLMDQLGLTKAADTIVGNSKIRGISGGERKRLSIAVEMISSPSVVFLDEPTSGLDSTAASSLIETLRKLANEGKTVIAVIHQPSQHIFSKFDDLLLLSEGRTMYFGDLHNVRSYMESHACIASPEIGTAEHVLDCISNVPIEDETQEEVERRMQRLADDMSSRKIDLGEYRSISSQGNKKIYLAQHHGPRASLLTQFRLLLNRAFREVSRGKAAIIIKTVQQVTLGLIYGGIYSIGTDQPSIQDRYGLLSLIAIGATNMATAAAIRTFPKEKAIVSNELASHMYRTLPYFIAKAISELPLVGVFNSIFGVIVYNLTGLSKMKGKFQRFLGLLSTHGLASESVGLLIGAISPNSDAALALFPAIIVLNIIFDGKNISPESTPRLLRWIPKVSLIRWGFEGLCLNEFEGLKFDASGPRRGPVTKTGSDALARFGLGQTTLGTVVRAQLTITATCWILSYLGLTLTRERFLTMQDPVEDEDGNGK